MFLSCVRSSDPPPQAASTATFRSALTRLTTEELSGVFNKIEEKVQAANSYVQTWLQYQVCTLARSFEPFSARWQSLWDMDMDTVIHEMGTDLKASGCAPF